MGCEIIRHKCPLILAIGGNHTLDEPALVKLLPEVQHVRELGLIALCYGF